MFASDLVDYLQGVDPDYFRMIQTLGVDFRLRHSRGVSLLLPKASDRKALFKKFSEGKSAKEGCALKDQMLSLIIPGSVSEETLGKIAAAGKPLVTASRKAFEVSSKGGKVSVGGAAVKAVKVEFLRCDAEGSPVESNYYVFECDKLPSGAKASEQSMKDVLEGLEGASGGAEGASENDMRTKLQELIDTNSTQALKCILGRLILDSYPQNGEEASTVYKAILGVLSIPHGDTHWELGTLVFLLHRIGAYSPAGLQSLIADVNKTVTNRDSENPSAELAAYQSASGRFTQRIGNSLEELRTKLEETKKALSEGGDVSELRQAYNSFFDALGAALGIDGKPLAWAYGAFHDITSAKEAAGAGAVFKFLCMFYSCRNAEDILKSSYLNESDNADVLGICEENIRAAYQTISLPDLSANPVEGGAEAPPAYLIEGGKLWLAEGGSIDELVSALQ